MLHGKGSVPVRWGDLIASNAKNGPLTAVEGGWLDQGPQGPASAGESYDQAPGMEWVARGCPLCSGPTFTDPHGLGFLPCPTCQPPTTDPEDGGYIIDQAELEIQQLRHCRLVGALLIIWGIGALTLVSMPGEAVGLLGKLGI